VRRLLPSSPHFFRPVGRVLLAASALLCVLAVVAPAPLEAPADPRGPPNPARSAWFLLWIQEVVSHDTRLVYAVVAMAGMLAGLPWLVRSEADHVRWFGHGHRAVAVLALACALAVLALTVVAAFFRGANWCLELP
jgi:hypothetical protein